MLNVFSDKVMSLSSYPVLTIVRKDYSIPVYDQILAHFYIKYLKEFPFLFVFLMAIKISN